MKKMLSVFIIGFLVLSGLGATASNNETSLNELEKNKTNNIDVVFSSIAIKEIDNKYTDVSLNDVSTYVMEPGYPVLPKIVKSVELPFGVKNVKVELTPNNIQEQTINYEIRPASQNLPLESLQTSYDTDIEKNEEIYASRYPFPSAWYDYCVRSGLNAKNEIVAHLIINIYPVRYTPASNEIQIAESADIKVTYDLPDSTPFSQGSNYDLVIIAPKKFSNELNKLVAHKIEKGVRTYIKTTEEIYDEYTGVDKPEQIKYFIKSAIETEGITYVLLVGGLKSTIFARPRDDPNQGTKGWYVPVRYNNLYDNPEHPLEEAEKLHDPGVITDLYYADIYDGEGNFSTWDPNGDGIFAAWGMPEDVQNDTGIDMVPDVSLGRLACTSKYEVRSVVNKIIKYEQSAADPSWFKKMIVISGDGFMDQEDLDFQWDTNSLSDGSYIIRAQSKNHDDVAGPVEEIHVTIDQTKNTVLTFNHDDNLRISSYPGYPIAEIVSVSEGNVLGNTDYAYVPTEGEAYGNEFYGWADLNYTGGILHIRGKTYDPRPYGNVTDIHVWIEDSDGDIIFSDWRYNCEMYYEGEWITGDKELNGGGGALYYMPEAFEKVVIWASNGKLTGEKDVINALSQGCGFAFLSGHGSPNVWADHYPGIPGNRNYGSITGLRVIGVKLYYKFIKFPLFPMNKIKNTDKLPIVLIGGCHNSQFNVSMIPSLLDAKNKRNMWTHGTPVPECFSWYLVKMPRKGAIATIGNTGLGYGTLGKDCTVGGLDGGICIEFFKQYANQYDVNGYGVLGDAYTQTLLTYTSTFDMENMDHAKSLTQWVLLGDPTLRIGGYS